METELSKFVDQVIERLARPNWCEEPEMVRALVNILGDSTDLLLRHVVPFCEHEMTERLNFIACKKCGTREIDSDQFEGIERLAHEALKR